VSASRFVRLCNCETFNWLSLPCFALIWPHSCALIRRAAEEVGALAEEVHVGCIQSSGTLPGPGKGLSRRRGHLLLSGNAKPLSANGRTLPDTGSGRGVRCSGAHAPRLGAAIISQIEEPNGRVSHTPQAVRQDPRAIPPPPRHGPGVRCHFGASSHPIVPGCRSRSRDRFRAKLSSANTSRLSQHGEACSGELGHTDGHRIRRHAPWQKNWRPSELCRVADLP